MTQQSELEKTQAELAKLQLERERFKFAQQQKRQQVVDDLGAGAVAVGKATGRAVGGVALVSILMLFGTVLGVLILAGGVVFVELTGWAGVTPSFAELPLLARIGAALGTQHYNYPYAALVGAVFGAYIGWKIATE